MNCPHLPLACESLDCEHCSELRDDFRGRDEEPEDEEEDTVRE